jgi:Spb1 C-terminal domain
MTVNAVTTITDTITCIITHVCSYLLCVQANAMASNPDMSDRQKLKVIQSALRKGKSEDKPTKAYVVAKKYQGGKPSASVCYVVQYYHYCAFTLQYYAAYALASEMYKALWFQITQKVAAEA